MTNPPTAYPPDYIKLPPAIACADADDALIVTMARVLGLCWGHKYRRSPPYTPDQLAELLGRPRTTLYRHLNKLQQLGWLRVDRHDRRLVLQPRVHVTEGRAPVASGPDQDSYDFGEQEGSDDQALREALQEAGIIGRPFHELLQQNVDPVLVRAWYLWTWAREQEWMDNPAGYIVNRLREGDAPPEAFLALAHLTPEETAILKRAWAGSEQTIGWPSLDDNPRLRSLAPLWAELYTAMRRHRT